MAKADFRPQYLIGDCIGTAVDGFEAADGTTISANLQSAFADWTAQFEQFAETSGFNWTSFHRVGLEPCKKLKHELGPAFQVSYHKPFEDAKHKLRDGVILIDPS